MFDKVIKTAKIDLKIAVHTVLLTGISICRSSERELNFPFVYIQCPRHLEIDSALIWQMSIMSRLVFNYRQL